MRGMSNQLRSFSLLSPPVKNCLDVAARTKIPQGNPDMPTEVQIEKSVEGYHMIADCCKLQQKASNLSVLLSKQVVSPFLDPQAVSCAYVKPPC